MLTSLLILSGCLGVSNEEEKETIIQESEQNTVQLSASWGLTPEVLPLDGTPVQLSVLVEREGYNWVLEPTIRNPQISRLSE